MHNTGAQAQGALFVAQALEGLKKAGAMLSPASPLGQAVYEALRKLGKEVGSAPPETQTNSLKSQLVDATRNAMLRAVMQRAQQQGGAQQQAPAQPQPAPQPPAAMAA